MIFFTPKPKELFGLQFAPCKKLHEIALMHHAGQPAHIGAKSLMRFNLSSYPFFLSEASAKKGEWAIPAAPFPPFTYPPVLYNFSDQVKFGKDTLGK